MLVTIDPKPRTPRPVWLRAPAPVGENYHNLKKLVQKLDLHTVCESAACPNVGECWNQRTATFMILGNVCTRRCGFCAVGKGAPLEVDYEEPQRVDVVHLLLVGHGADEHRGVDHQMHDHIGPDRNESGQREQSVDEKLMPTDERRTRGFHKRPF